MNLIKIRPFIIAFAIIYLPMITTLCKAQDNKDQIILMNGDSFYTNVISVNDKIAVIADGKDKSEIYPDQVYRIYKAKKNKTYAPSFIEKNLELVKGSKPEIYKIKIKDNSAPTFAELEADGDIMVYFVKDSNFALGGGIGTGSKMGLIGFTTVKSWFALKKSTGEIILLRQSDDNALFPGNKKRAENLKRFFTGAPEVIASFENEKTFNYPIFLSYIKKYNALQVVKVDTTDQNSKIIY
ncbi:hypothetical protein [Sphingobacterium anhuiense]|uniref:hypothetical protein n=1 Tax=Sphingobacterium anhuiense TaxID=493780 RepID=UPI003C2D483E